MYLHLGQKVVVPFDDIIGIFDIETTTIGEITRNYLAVASSRDRVINVSMEMPKSFVVCQPRKKSEAEDPLVYISQLSTATLKKRKKVTDMLKGI